jgi:hypothetical protein
MLSARQDMGRIPGGQSRFHIRKQRSHLYSAWTAWRTRIHVAHGRHIMASLLNAWSKALSGTALPSTIQYTRMWPLRQVAPRRAVHAERGNMPVPLHWAMPCSVFTLTRNRPDEELSFLKTVPRRIGGGRCGLPSPCTGGILSDAATSHGGAEPELAPAWPGPAWILEGAPQRGNTCSWTGQWRSKVGEPKG